MAVLIQYDFFKDPLECQIEATSSSLEKVRKGTYAKINELKKECNELKTRLEILERYICQSQK